MDSYEHSTKNCINPTNIQDHGLYSVLVSRINYTLIVMNQRTNTKVYTQSIYFPVLLEYLDAYEEEEQKGKTSGNRKEIMKVRNIEKDRYGLAISKNNEYNRATKDNVGEYHSNDQV